MEARPNMPEHDKVGWLIEIIVQPNGSESFVAEVICKDQEGSLWSLSDCGKTVGEVVDNCYKLFLHGEKEWNHLGIMIKRVNPL